ncbi:hypothetical protein [Streptococcus anginosus]|uniref:hypothetical protein n=1 Tax=Streptococcus anginosus TaxID=1328 RepID=UPI00321ADB1A
MNEEILNELKKLLGLFPRSYINQNLEVILIPKTNTYFRLEGVGSRRDIIAKLLMWCTRTISKERPYKQELRNFQYRYDNTVRLGRYVGKIITTEMVDLIYQKLGNGVRPELTYKFIDSDFDMEVLND